MDEFVPEDIRTLIERIEAKQGEKYQARKRAKDAERKRLRRIEALRKKRKTELVAACGRIGGWIESFNDTIGPAFWELLGSKSSVVLFVGKFWKGEPTPPGDATCNAQLRLGGPDAGLTEYLVYEEVHKGGPPTVRLPMLGTGMLWQRVHPDFVLQCDAHLSGPAAWENVRRLLQGMDRRMTAV